MTGRNVAPEAPKRMQGCCLKNMIHFKKTFKKIREKIANYFFPEEIDIYRIPVSTVHRCGPLTEEEAEELLKYIDSF